MSKQEIDRFKSVLDTQLATDPDWLKIPPLSRDRVVADSWQHIAESYLHDIQKNSKPKRGRRKKSDDEHASDH